MKPRTKAVRALAVVTVLAALAACSPPGGGSDGGAVNPGNNSTGGGTGTAQAAGADVRYQLYQAPTGFNPFVAGNGADGDISSLQYRALVNVANSQFQGDLATKWQISPDATTYTFDLGTTDWSDGQPVTSADVVYSFESYADPATKSTFAGNLGEVQGYADFAAGKAKTISGMTAPDDHTVVLKLSAPDSAFLSDLTSLRIVPKHVFGSVKRSTFTGNQMFREPKVGDGPYMFSRWVTDDEIEFVPDPKSTLPHPLAHVYAQYLTTDVARAQLDTGEIDIAQLAATDVAGAEKDSKLTVLKRPGTGVLSLYTALNTGKLADARVRQAILYAIDRKAIVQKVLAGNGTVPQTMLFTPAWAVPNDLTQYNYDPAKAKRLLAQAGWKASTEVDLDIVPGTADRDTVMNIVQGELKAVGMNAKLKQLQPAQLTDLVADSKFDLLLTSLGLVPSEPGSFNQRFTCKGGLNISKYCNPKLDKLLQAAVATTDQSKRAGLYAQAQKILNNDQPAIPLYVADNVWATTKRVHGFDPAIGGLWTSYKWTVS